VLRAIEELGFVRNDAARHLRTGGGHTIGLVLLDLANPFFTDLARGVEDAANRAGYFVIVCNSDEDPGKEDAYLALLEERSVQGLLIVPVGSVAPRVARLRRRGTSVVLLNHRAAGPDECGVGVDDLVGGELAMSHLLALGHERVAYVTSSSHVWPTDERGKGAMNALRDAGKRSDALVELSVPHLNVAHGRDAGERLHRVRRGSGDPAHLRAAASPHPRDHRGRAAARRAAQGARPRPRARRPATRAGGQGLHDRQPPLKPGQLGAVAA
jgi:LacI family transcriptional regulator